MIYRLQRHKTLSLDGEKWVRDVTEQAKQIMVDHLDSQGRSGGEGPRLSPISKKLDRAADRSSNDGIAANTTTEIKRKRWRTVGILGIAKGQATAIAFAQNDGTITEVTQRMRGYLASQGIYLKKSTVVIVIPGRQFWDLTIEDSKKYAIAQLEPIREKARKR